MRTSSLALLAAAFTLACADAPTSTLLEPAGASLNLGKAPPPWALIDGEILTDGGGATLARLSLSRSGEGSALMSHGVATTATYQAWLLVTPGNQTQLLRFTNGGTAQFSNGAMLRNVNGKVAGHGSVTVDGHTYELSTITYFTANADCVTTGYTGGCATFGAADGSISSTGTSTWTGILSNNGGGPDWVFPPGWGDCYPTGCVCVDCAIIGSYDTKSGRRR
jgi:hypothetical protein